MIIPGKGWVDYDGLVYFEEYQNIVNLGYARYDWAYLEPQKGEYNWKVIDDFISHHATYGKRLPSG